MKIQLTADRNHFYNKKPKDFEIGKINNRLCAVNVKKTDLHSLAEMIGDKGMTWCPGVFNGKRKNDNFISAQIIGLDFDEGVGFDEILSRSEKYMLPILFAYETFSSINKSKFRVVLLLSEIIADKEMYNTVIRQLMIIFPECDKSCKDASRMFFGGKNLFYYNQDQPTLDIKTLSMNFEKYMSDRYGERHYREAISRMEKNGGKLSHSFPNIIECDNFPPHQKKRYRQDTISKLISRCMLYKEFVDNSVWLYYKELYGILLNLIQVDKGVDVFLNIINSSERDTYTNKDWTFYAKYAKKKKYIPQQCANFCPYHEKCQHEINMLETAVIQRRDIVVLKEPEFVDITSVQSDLYNAFNKAMAADDKKIHIIKAQTSIGKTHMYIDYLKNADAPCMIAVPTNILKHQVHRECIKAGIDAIKTPSIQEIRDELPQDIYDKIQTLYATGNHKRANIYLKEKAKEIPVLKNYLEEKENVMNYHGHIITTHHRVLYSNESWLKKYKIIIDEDILMTIVCNQEKIDLADVEEFSEKNRIPKTIRKYLNKLLSLSEEYELFSVEPIEDHLDECSFNINDLMKGKYFYSDGEYIYFYRRNGLSDTKYVVLSATASEYVYEHFFGKDTIIFHECPTAKYKGQLIQHYGGSYSRAYIKKNMGIFDNIKNKYGNIDTITFKKYSSSDSELHIGNTEGINSLEGKDIAVIGTPHQPPFIYSLLALHMDCADTEQPHYRDIVHNGYHFWFYTYKNEILRNIQLWMIESELEQCVGRARLLRNDCTVHLFSDYPIRHAKLTRD